MTVIANLPIILAAGAPGGSATEGQTYWDTTANALYIYEGGAWVAIGGGAGDGLGSDGDKGDVTVGGTGTTLTIDPNAVTYAKMQDVSAGDRLIGRITGAGDPEEIACTAAGRALIDDADAAAQRTTLGLGSAALAATVDFDPAGEADSEIAAHVAAGDPHAQYQRESEKNAANGYPGLDGSSKLTGSQQTYGSLANTACEGNDARLSDARTPTAHAASHKSGGGDPILLNELGAPTGSVAFNDQQATSFRVENRTSDPVSPTVGQIWLRTDL